MTQSDRCRRIQRPVALAAALLAAAMAAGPVRAQGQGSGPPIVFVPGTSGSYLLFTDGSAFWLDSNSLLGGTPARGKLSADGDERGVEDVRPGEVLDSVRFVVPASVVAQLQQFRLMPPDKPLHCLPIYGPFLAWARATFGTSAIFLAPYDWRKGAGAESSALIDAVVDRAIAQTGAPKVILLSHSLGGLVCRDYVAGPGRGKVDALIAVGTPWLGAPKTIRGLEWGYNFGVGFTARPNDWLKNLYWYVIDPANPGRPVRKDPPFRLTFLSNEVTAGLARNYPCVYQQLPTDDLQRLYGKPFLFGLTPEATLARLRGWNPALYDAAQAWRKDRLKADNFGVAHYAIAGVCDPSGDPGEFQDMQMAMPGPEHLTSRGGDRLLDGINQRIINDRRRAFQAVADRKIPVFLDEFIATDTDVALGDGTSPLLSATAGAQRRSGSPLDATAAETYLGPGVQVRVLALQPAYSHGSMLNDEAVRQEVIRCVSERRAAAGLAPDPRADDVGIMTLELSTRAGNLAFGTVENVTMRVAGADFRTNNQALAGGGLFSDVLSSGTTARYAYRAPRCPDPATGRMRPLRRSDLLGSKLTLTKAGLGNWSCSGVRLLVDGRPVVDAKDAVVLSLSRPSVEFPIAAR